MSDTSRWRLVYYKTAAGRSPVREYIAELDARQRARITFDLDLLRDFGIDLGAPYVRSLGRGLWELRTTGSTQHRVVFFTTWGKRIVLLHAFTKKTQKTPRAEIETALHRMVDFQERSAE